MAGTTPHADDVGLRRRATRLRHCAFSANEPGYPSPTRASITACSNRHCVRIRIRLPSARQFLTRSNLSSQTFRPTRPNRARHRVIPTTPTPASATSRSRANSGSSARTSPKIRPRNTSSVPGQQGTPQVRLRCHRTGHGIKDADGRVTEVHAEYDPSTKAARTAPICQGQGHHYLGQRDTCGAGGNPPLRSPVLATFPDAGDADFLASLNPQSRRGTGLARTGHGRTEEHRLAI